MNKTNLCYGCKMLRLKSDRSNKILKTDGERR